MVTLAEGIRTVGTFHDSNVKIPWEVREKLQVCPTFSDIILYTESEVSPGFRPRVRQIHGYV